MRWLTASLSKLSQNLGDAATLVESGDGFVAVYNRANHPLLELSLKRERGATSERAKVTLAAAKTRGNRAEPGGATICCV
jgi:hypothetical protein